MPLSSKVDMIFGPLKTRETPKQARAVKRIHIILSSTADLLTEQPINLLTTTMIAKHAGIPVSSIYRYFSDVTHVMQELYLQSAQNLRDRVLITLEDTQSWPGWRDRFRQITLLHRDHIRQYPFYSPLLMHFVSNRPTVAAEDGEREYVTELLETRWKRGEDGFRDGDPEVVAKTMIQIAITMEDMIAAQQDDDQKNLFAEEMFKVLASYLANYLND